jgi:hypothetical protein
MNKIFRPDNSRTTEGLFLGFRVAGDLTSPSPSVPSLSPIAQVVLSGWLALASALAIRRATRVS